MFFERLLRVHHQEDDLGETYGLKRVRDRQLLELFLDPAATPQPCGIVDTKRPIPPCQIDRDRVTGNTGLGAREQPLFPKQPIDQCRFSGIGPADHRDTDRHATGGVLVDIGRKVMHFHLRRRRIGQCHAQPVIEIGEAFPVLSGDRDRLAEPEFIRLQNSRLGGAALALIRDQNCGFARLAHKVGKCAIGWRRPRARVDQKHERIGGVDGGLRLLLHAAAQALRRCLFKPRRVDSGERKIPEPCLRFAPVARDSR